MFFIMVACCYAVDGANILGIFIFPSYSHQIPMLRLSRALAARGHNLTVITANPSKEVIANHTEIDTSFCYDVLRKGQLGVTFQSKMSVFKCIKDSSLAMVKLAEVQLKSRPIQDFLTWAKDVKFDVVLYEELWMSPFLALVHTLGSPPVIGISTLESTSILSDKDGTPLNLAYTPVFQPFSDHMTFYERLMNVITYLWLVFIREWYVHPGYAKLITEVFGEGLPSLHELERNKTLLMFTGDGSLVYPHALTPNVIQLGPMHILAPKPLPTDLEKWVSGAEDGVIYFSLGSNMQGTALPSATREAFLSVFERFSTYHVVWKWESDTNLPGQPKNVVFRKWIPQQDLLAHPKVKLFITQGGLQSLQETIHHAVPVVCIPLFGDQDMNCRKIEYTEAGVVLDFFHLTSDSVFKAVNDVLCIPKYRNNMKRMSDISKDRVLSPMDQGVWWVEYVLRHNGASHLRPATLDLSWSQYLLLDVAALVTAIVCPTIFTLFKLSQILYTKVHRTYFCESKVKKS